MNKFTTESVASHKENILVIGSEGTIGKAIYESLCNDYNVFSLSRQNTIYNEFALSSIASEFKQNSISFSRVICCIGTLHDNVVAPEKSLKDIDEAKLLHYFHVNAVLPMICMKVFLPLLNKAQSNTSRTSVFACLSAMVGSSTDNKLGGWYGYRSSKAALNSFIKTTSIEMARVNKSASIITIHPGTTQGNLSRPFAKNIDSSKYYTPKESAQRIIEVINNTTTLDSGAFYNWDGRLLPY